ncbi:MAG: hypothetical protein ACLPZ0_03290 [Steroidobacteraceae bacterium]
MPERRRHDGWEPKDDMPDRADNAGLPDRAPPLGQLALDFSPPRHRRESALSRTPPDVQPAAAPARYFTRREAAAYVRCSVRFLDGMGMPFIRKGRCKLYDRIDLDERMQQDKCRGRAWKETLWPVNVDSTAARIRGSGGSTSFSRMDAAYAKALGVSNAPRLKPT